MRELVVCSLKSWDDVWNRNNFLTDALLKRNPELRVLFVEPPTDVLYDLSKRRWPTRPRLRRVSADGRLRVLCPLKLLPRRIGPAADALLRSQVVAATRLVGFSRPALWINDVTYAPLIAKTRWPSLYDVSDDWLLVPFAPRELARLRRLDKLALKKADEVVVCSTALAESRGANRAVSLVRNAVDAEHFRRPRPRPADMPTAPVAVYAGTIHDARVDVELVLELARALPSLTLAFVGPNSLCSDSQKVLAAVENVVLLGPRPYRDVPAYLQHADVVIVPHLVSPFMESLDPIKAYECLAIATPTVATPVAGFREFAHEFYMVEREAFPRRVAEVLSAPSSRGPKSAPPSWEQRSVDFEAALVRSLEGSAIRWEETVR